MHVQVVLNRKGGTLRTADLDMLTALIRDEFVMHGHHVEIDLVEGKEIGRAIEAAARRPDLDVLMVGGGDGTVSCAAAAVMGTGIALAILPAGTMNLYARTLQMPLDLPAAINALASGRPVDVDIATVNDRPFVHQFAVGMHARMVRTRERLDYASRIGKMWASTRAIAMTMQRLPLVRLDLEIDGKPEQIETPAVAVSNNMYGAGHLPFADNPRGGVLGVYICETTDRRAVMRLGWDVWRGRWRENPSLRVVTAEKVDLLFPGLVGDRRAVRDGELETLEPRSHIQIRPGKLKVLAPEEASYL
ncbi:diacylglycerol/lipid kinase family protein [Aureimonas frigidaquae]|uniref:diacylglycerol/lipid kinase family protein n=1 Tax=Aureimonas frigidaquae TaxID=424757 RepID=UPI00078568AB|nr:diacylglycerol kinase family protein [Aureimonas frigidaquae]